MVHAVERLRELNLIAIENFYMIGFPYQANAQLGLSRSLTRQFYTEAWKRPFFTVRGGQFLTGDKVCFLPVRQRETVIPIVTTCLEALTPLRITTCPSDTTAELLALFGETLVSKTKNLLSPTLMRAVLRAAWADNGDRVRTVLARPADVGAMLTYCASDIPAEKRLAELGPLPLLMNSQHGLALLSDGCIFTGPDDFIRELLAAAPHYLLEQSLQSHEVIKLLVDVPNSSIRTLSVALFGQKLIGLVLDSRTYQLQPTATTNVVPWDQRVLSPEWLRLCWRFLQMRCIAKSREDAVAAVRAALGDWALVPVHGNRLYKVSRVTRVLLHSCSSFTFGLSVLACSAYL